MLPFLKSVLDNVKLKAYNLNAFVKLWIEFNLGKAIICGSDVIVSIITT